MKKILVLLLLAFSSVAFASQETPKWVQKHLSFAFPADEEGQWEITEAGPVPPNGKVVEWRHKERKNDVFLAIRMDLPYFMFQNVTECLEYAKKEYSEDCLKIISVSDNNVIAVIYGEDIDIVRYYFTNEDVYIFSRGREEGTFTPEEETKWIDFIKQIEVR